jgi:tRNA dimethylallyltransferase
MDFDLLNKADAALEINNDEAVIIVAGPTGSGKSALAIEWANRHRGVIINADSMQLYQDLRLLTARPSLAEETMAPHALYGTVPHDQTCSALWWREQAITAIADARRHGLLPIVTGGTGFYLDALMNGLSPIPDVSTEIRQQAEDLLADIGSPGLYELLRAVDPVMAERLKPGDRQRVARAWGVHRATGKSLAQWQALPREGAPAGMVFHCRVLMPPRAWLYPRLDQRFRGMVDGGAIDEVKNLCALDPARQSPLFKAVGVQQIIDYLHGVIDRETMIANAAQSTRHYAKRQMTWFRHRIIKN